MSVLEVEKMWSKDRFDVSTSNNLQKKATIAEAYQIIVEVGTTKVEVSEAEGLPGTGESYPGLAQIFVTRRAFTKVSPILWIAEIQYQGEFGDEGPDAPATSARPEVSWTDTETDERIDQDADGNALVNKNDERIEGLTAKVADLVLNVSRNYSFFDPAATHRYRHSVNSDKFAGFDPGTGRLIRFSAKQVWDESANGYWKVNASIQFRYPYNTTSEKAWYTRVLHEGFKVRETSTSEPTRAWDKETKDYVVSPVLLKEDGTLETNRENAHWLEFKIYTPLPYKALGLLD